MKSRARLNLTHIIIAVLITYQFFSCGGRGDIYVNESMLIEDSVATLHIKNLVDTSAVKVYLNGSEAKKISLINNGLSIRVPSIMDTTAQEGLTAALYVRDNKGVNLYSTPITYLKHPTVTSTPSILYENNGTQFTGKNLNVAGLYVSFNGIDAKMTAQQFGRFTVTVPELADTTIGQSVNVIVTNKGEPVFEKKYAIEYTLVRLINYADKANWIGGILTVDSNIINGVPLVFQDTVTATNGFVTISRQKMEDGNIYDNVMRTHPKWIPQGVIQGMFPILNSKSSRIFKAKIGFLNNWGSPVNTSIDGVRFRVRLHYYVNGAKTMLTLYNSHKTYNRQLIDVSVNIPAKVPEEFSVELAVDAGNTSNSDWAAWVDPKIEIKYIMAPLKITPVIINPEIIKLN